MPVNGHCFLSLGGTKPVLNELAEQLLDDGDRIEVSRSSHTITFFSTRAKAETVLDGIDKVVHRMRMRTVDADSVGNTRLTNEELEALGKITNTALNYDADRDKVRIAL